MLPKPSRAFPAGNVTAVSTTLGWRLVNERMPAEWTVSLGEANEQLAERFAISRERQDEFAARSHNLADAAWKAGFYDDLVVPRAGCRPGPRRGHPARLHRRRSWPGSSRRSGPTARSPPATPRRSTTAPPPCCSAPRRRRAHRASTRWPGSPAAARHALEPQVFGFAPVEAAEQALDRAGIAWADVAAVELNEAFAVQSLACVDAWKVDPEIVNAKGGAIAIGHPLGASGGRILGTLAHRLRESGDRWGVAAICIGVGQALAVVLENVVVTRAG